MCQPLLSNNILGAWQLVCFYDQLPNVLRSCEHHLQSSTGFPRKLMRKRENQQEDYNYERCWILSPFPQHTEGFSSPPSPLSVALHYYFPLSNLCLMLRTWYFLLSFWHSTHGLFACSLDPIDFLAEAAFQSRHG